MNLAPPWLLPTEVVSPIFLEAWRQQLHLDTAETPLVAGLDSMDAGISSSPLVQRTAVQLQF